MGNSLLCKRWLLYFHPESIRLPYQEHCGILKEHIFRIFSIALEYIMSQNGQRHFKNLAPNAARFLNCVFDHFGMLCIKWLNIFSSHTDQVRFNNYLNKIIRFIFQWLWSNNRFIYYLFIYLNFIYPQSWDQNFHNWKNINRKAGPNPRYTLTV